MKTIYHHFQHCVFVLCFFLFLAASSLGVSADDHSNDPGYWYLWDKKVLYEGLQRDSDGVPFDNEDWFNVYTDVKGGLPYVASMRFGQNSVFSESNAPRSERYKENDHTEGELLYGTNETMVSWMDPPETLWAYGSEEYSIRFDVDFLKVTDYVGGTEFFEKPERDYMGDTIVYYDAFAYRYDPEEVEELKRNGYMEPKLLKDHKNTQELVTSRYYREDEGMGLPISISKEREYQVFVPRGSSDPDSPEQPILVVYVRVRCEKVEALYAYVYKWVDVSTNQMQSVVITEKTTEKLTEAQTDTNIQDVYVNAEDKSGESKFPVWVVIPPVIGGGLVLINTGKGKNKNINKKTKKQEPKKSAKKKNEADRQEDKKEDEKEEKQYEMRVQKDFGNVLNPGRRQKVSARMMEISANGAAKAADDLTRQIKIYSHSGLQISDVQMQGTYMTAMISAPEEMDGQDVYVIFDLGGIYRLHMIFTVIAPKLVFWDEETNLMRVDPGMRIIAGDTGRYRFRFVLQGVAEEPVSITAETDTNVVVSFVPEEEHQNTYYGILENHTQPFIGRIFTTHVEYAYVNIKAVLKDGSEIKADFRCVIYKEGINVQCSDLSLYEDRLAIIAIENENPRGLDSVFKPTGFRLFVALLDVKDGYHKVNILTGKECHTTFEPIDGTRDYSEGIKKTFKYELDTLYASDGKYSVCAQNTLAQKNQNPFYMELTVHCSYHSANWNLDIPLAIRGVEPPLHTQRWDEERNNLRRNLQQFGLKNDHALLVMIRHLDCFSADEICMIRRAIIVESNYYYTKEYMEFMSLDQALGRCEFTFNVVKFAGDQCFSYLIKTYCGGVAVEAFVTPFKDMFVNWAGEYWAAMENDKDFSAADFGPTKLLETLSQGVENSLFALATGEKKPTPKEFTTMIAGFLFLSFLRNYYSKPEKERDVAKAVYAAFGDLSINFVKNYLGDLFKKLISKETLKSQDFAKFLDKAFPYPKYIKFHYDKNAVLDAKTVKEMLNGTDMLGDGSGVAEKFFTEILALPVSEIYNRTTNEVITKFENAYEKGGVCAFTIEYGAYTLVFNNPIRLSYFMLEKMFDIIVDTIGNIIPRSPQPIFDQECRIYYRPDEVK